MKNFAKYARYYDLLYKNKDYKREAGYIDSLIRRYSMSRCGTMLDIGCGTGNHDLWFAKKGYKVTGIDRSREMIALALNKVSAEDGLSFRVYDASDFSLQKKFDTIVSLFHVMSYFTTNEMLTKCFKNIYKHLKKRGLFIFDFWYGPAVLTQMPKTTVKKISDSDRSVSVKRVAVPRINFSTDTVDMRFNITVRGKESGPGKLIREAHTMRYYFLPELELMLRCAGFKRMTFLRWMSLNKGPDEKAWSGVVVAQN